MNEQELRLECAKLAVTACNGGLGGDYSKIFSEIWSSVANQQIQPKACQSQISDDIP